MTDKQIIIDGVDVSGCPHLIEDYQWWNVAGREEHDINRCALSFDEYTDFEEDEFCKKNPNCYYKQLKAKEQECEAYKMEADEGKEINAELKAENDELKEYIKHLHNLCGNETDKQYEYKQTLTEIKDIAERGFKHSQCNCGAKADLDLILQKISECEGNDEM